MTIRTVGPGDRIAPSESDPRRRWAFVAHTMVLVVATAVIVGATLMTMELLALR